MRLGFVSAGLSAMGQFCQNRIMMSQPVAQTSPLPVIRPESRNFSPEARFGARRFSILLRERSNPGPLYVVSLLPHRASKTVPPLQLAPRLEFACRTAIRTISLVPTANAELHP